MKKPLRRWLATRATSMVPTTPPAASGVRKPRTSRAPAPSSVTVAISAWTRPGRMPMDSNQRAVPGSLPPPNAWFQPCAMIVPPTAIRSTSAAMSAPLTDLLPCCRPCPWSRYRECSILYGFLALRSGLVGGEVSAYDLVIRGGMVVDGNGGPPRTADVAITGGVIADVGPGLGRGRREVGADGALVTPGFVDIHTHDDGQATWDERLLPSSWHGVTTAVKGNCGVGFAPPLQGAGSGSSSSWKASRTSRGRRCTPGCAGTGKRSTI